MPIAFSTSLRALAAEQERGRLAGLLLVLVLVAMWARWLLGAELVITAVSDRARIEVSRAAVPVTTMLAGRVAESRLGLGRRVEAGACPAACSRWSPSRPPSSGCSSAPGR